jgi:hypothetical protein
MELRADPSRSHLELSVAGLGFGYCGAQLSSDGTTIQFAGSIDMGTTCLPSASVCVSASDLTAQTQCPAPSFGLPAVGRMAGAGPNGTFAASLYGSDIVLLNGTGTDSLAFGPAAPTPGVAEFQTGGSTQDDGGKSNNPMSPPGMNGGAVGDASAD